MRYGLNVMRAGLLMVFAWPRPVAAAVAASTPASLIPPQLPTSWESHQRRS